MSVYDSDHEIISATATPRHNSLLHQFVTAITVRSSLPCPHTILFFHYAIHMVLHPVGFSGFGEMLLESSGLVDICSFRCTSNMFFLSGVGGGLFTR